MKRLLSFIATSIIASSMLSATVAAANPANFYLSAGSATVGNTVYVSISQDGDQVNTVTAKLTYDTSKLQLLGVSCSGALGNSQPESNGVTCYGAGGASTNGGAVATASFKALAAGSASVSMASSSIIASSGSDIWSHGSNGTVVSISNPAPASTPSGSGSSGSTTSSSSVSGSTTSSTSTKPSSDKGKQTTTTSQQNSSAAAPSSSTGKTSQSAKKQSSEQSKPQSFRHKNTSQNSSSLYVLLAIFTGVIIGVASPFARTKFSAISLPKLAFQSPIKRVKK